MIFYLVKWTIIFYIIYRIIKIYKYQRILATIPSPKGKFFIGNMLEMLSQPDEQFHKFRKYSLEFYPIFKLQTPYLTAVSLLSPNDIELVLSGSKHLRKSLIYRYLHPWLGTGLLTSTGNKWQNRRKILTPAFHFNILQQFITIFNEETVKLVDELKQELNKDEFTVMPYITHFTLQSISETAMNVTNIDKQTIKEYRDAIYAIGKLLVKRVARPWLLIQTLYKFTSLNAEQSRIIKTLHNFSNQIINDRAKEFNNQQSTTYSNRKRMAMLDLLLTAKTNGADIDYEGIREEVDTFMFEGHDTTSVAISFILLSLAHHKHIQTKVFEEISSVLGQTKIPDYNDLQQLKYTERVIKEVLRLFPSVPFISRLAEQEFVTTTGHRIPKGTILHFHIFDIHRNPNHFPEPLKFDPDRFLLENSNTRHPFSYIPFSAGPRNCIGQRFALLELKTVLCGILRRFEIEPVTDMWNIRFQIDLILRPITDIKIKITERNK